MTITQNSELRAFGRIQAIAATRKPAEQMRRQAVMTHHAERNADACFPYVGRHDNICPDQCGHQQRTGEHDQPQADQPSQVRE